MLGTGPKAVPITPTSRHTEHGARHLDSELKRAHLHFMDYFKVKLHAGQSYYKVQNEKYDLKLLSNFKICARYYGQLSANFQGFCRSITRAVAGDEKLLHFTGHGCQYLRFVPSKPARIGIWIYELCGRLDNGLPYCLDLRVHTEVKREGNSVPVIDIVKQWGDVIEKFSTQQILLVFDSYYFSAPVMKYLAEKKFNFIASVSQEKVAADLMMLLKRAVTGPGQQAGYYNASKQLVFVHYYDKDKRIGRRTMVSDTFLQISRPAKIGKNAVTHGVCSSFRDMINIYKENFNACDAFNGELARYGYPLRQGGKGHPGQEGQEDVFSFCSCVLNTFFSYLAINKMDRSLPTQPRE
jgi:hypothetical protein